MTLRICKNCKYYVLREGMKNMTICKMNNSLVFQDRRACTRFEYKDELKDRTLGLFEE